MGSKEFKDICICNEFCTLGEYSIWLDEDGKWWIEGSQYKFRASKIDILIDWLVSIGYLEETRFRLTAHQKSIVRSKIWEWIGFGIGAIIIATGVAGLLILWLSGYDHL